MTTTETPEPSRIITEKMYTNCSACKWHNSTVLCSEGQVIKHFVKNFSLPRILLKPFCTCEFQVAHNLKCIGHLLEIQEEEYAAQDKFKTPNYSSQPRSTGIRNLFCFLTQDNIQLKYLPCDADLDGFIKNSETSAGFILPFGVLTLQSLYALIWMFYVISLENPRQSSLCLFTVVSSILTHI